MHFSPRKVALAFSGGLDTSYCVPRLAEAGWEVHTVYVNTGGSSVDERAAIELVLLVGHYVMLASFLTTLRVEPDRRRGGRA